MLNRTFFFKTVTLVTLVLLFLFSVTAHKTTTITKTRGYTSTIYPRNCKATTTTTTTTTTITSKTTTTTTSFTTDISTTIVFSTTTTTTTIPIAPGKRSHNDNVVCNLDRNGSYFKNEHTKIVFCKPTVYLPCPKVCTKTLTTTTILAATVTTISTSTSLYTTLSLVTITNTIITCNPTGGQCLTPDVCCSGICFFSSGTVGTCL
ncbi:hypothetical protein Glove_199g37 [Diversispora epigaea]|uniref:Hydrophobin n=1 Tax=Diversispora epigaea TaxID=1348612 RepID=A0A397IUE7_9GLOM|nr:hypothetical protein Glove_199g37 [Diversispora epigaea]